MNVETGIAAPMNGGGVPVLQGWRAFQQQSVPAEILIAANG